MKKNKLKSLIFILSLIANISLFADDINYNAVGLKIVNDTLYSIVLVDNYSKFPKYIFKFNQLKKFEIGSCGYSEIPDEIKTFTELEFFSILRCLNFNFSDVFKKLQFNNKLKELVLWSDSIVSIPPEIKYLKELEKIDFRYNKIKEIPIEIANLTELKSIDLDYNEIEELPDEICNLEKLGSIYLSNNKLKKIKFKNVNYTIGQIILTNNSLENIPLGLEKLKGLHSIFLDNNENLFLDKICDIVKELPKLSYLKIQYINKSKDDELPSNIGNLAREGLVVCISRSQFTEQQIKRMKEIGINISYS